MILVPMTVGDACAFVDRHHRHHPAPQGGLWAVGVAVGGEVIGVAIVAQPVARALADEWTAEVRRVAVIEGHPNACSKLYGACWRAARALGYRRLVTYTLASEPGVSLRAAGWRIEAEVRGRSWHCASRPRVDRHPTQDKLRWAAPGWAP
jgi:hypothetical protein